MLRDYQAEAVESIWTYFYQYSGNPVLAMPTGTGKSHVIASFVKKVMFSYPGQRVMMLTHVRELIGQNAEKMIQHWPNAPLGIYSAGLKRKDYNNPITFAGIQSVAKKVKLFQRTNLIIVDECHLVPAKANTSYRTFVNGLLQYNSNLKVIGLSATPYRLGTGLITDGGLFTDICFDVTRPEHFARFIDEGYMVPLVSRHTKEKMDLEGIHMRGGEFVESELADKFGQDYNLSHNALTEAATLAHDRKKWLVFATSLEHVELCHQILSQMGITSAYVHSKMGDKFGGRDKVLADFKAGRYRALINRDILTTGFDEPGIDCIVMLRPTQSPGLWVQMLGRGTRPVYAKGYDVSSRDDRRAAIAAGSKRNCLVLDFAKNIERLGPVDDPVIPKVRGKGRGESATPVKICEVCDTYCHISVRSCPNCGTEFPKGDPKYTEQASNLSPMSLDEGPHKPVPSGEVRNVVKLEISLRPMKKQPALFHVELTYQLTSAYKDKKFIKVFLPVESLHKWVQSGARTTIAKLFGGTPWQWQGPAVAIVQRLQELPSPPQVTVVGPDEKGYHTITAHHYN